MWIIQEERRWQLGTGFTAAVGLDCGGGHDQVMMGVTEGNLGVDLGGREGGRELGGGLGDGGGSGPRGGWGCCEWL
jgi:hypothetical protein